MNSSIYFWKMSYIKFLLNKNISTKFLVSIFLTTILPLQPLVYLVCIENATKLSFIRPGPSFSINPYFTLTAIFCKLTR